MVGYKPNSPSSIALLYSSKKQFKSMKKKNPTYNIKKNKWGITLKRNKRSTKTSNSTEKYKKYLKGTELDFSYTFQLLHIIQSQINISREANHKLH